jgi:hypothetical protein
VNANMGEFEFLHRTLGDSARNESDDGNAPAVICTTGGDGSTLA